MAEFKLRIGRKTPITRTYEENRLDVGKIFEDFKINKKKYKLLVKSDEKIMIFNTKSRIDISKLEECVIVNDKTAIDLLKLRYNWNQSIDYINRNKLEIILK